MVLSVRRLTPAYLVVLGFYATLLVRLGSGPSWNKFVEQPAEACRHNWFYNLIYLNNYIDNGHQVSYHECCGAKLQTKAPIRLI